MKCLFQTVISNIKLIFLQLIGRNLISLFICFLCVLISLKCTFIVCFWYLFKLHHIPIPQQLRVPFITIKHSEVLLVNLKLELKQTDFVYSMCQTFNSWGNQVNYTCFRIKNDITCEGNWDIFIIIYTFHCSLEMSFLHIFFFSFGILHTCSVKCPELERELLK